jgi:hypothetical protein
MSVEIPNVEQGISNDEVKSLLWFRSAFVIRYSAVYTPPAVSLSSFYAACEKAFA